MQTATPTIRAIYERLRTVLDPEMPINVVDLGIVHDVRLNTPDRGCVEIDVTPTFVGCPALDIIRRDIETQVGALPDVNAVHVRFVNDPPWSVERISDAGRAALRDFGVSTPARGTCAGGDSADETTQAVQLTVRGATPNPVPCPFCNSRDTTRESQFGPTRCRMIYYCNACRNSFEQLKPI